MTKKTRESVEKWLETWEGCPEKTGVVDETPQQEGGSEG